VKKIIVASLIIFLLGFSFLFLRFVIGGDEDTWLCENGQWVKHGNPSRVKPSETCGQPKKTPKIIEMPKTEEECLNRGGKWGRIGLGSKDECNLPTADANRECNDSSECESVCLAEMSTEERREAMKGKSFNRKGKCSSWMIVVGCQARVNNGKTSLICID
jgi:hypothetical protein